MARSPRYLAPPPATNEPRINDRIRAREVRLVDPEGGRLAPHPHGAALYLGGRVHPERHGRTHAQSGRDGRDAAGFAGRLHVDLTDAPGQGQLHQGAAAACEAVSP